jgi:hypothetical protein
MSDEERAQDTPPAEDVEAIEIDDKLLKRLVDDLSPRLAEALKAQLAPADHPAVLLGGEACHGRNGAPAASYRPKALPTS